MALERSPNGRPNEVSMVECPFSECGEEIKPNQSFAKHWPNCPANPLNGGDGGFPSTRKAKKRAESKGEEVEG